MKLKPHALLCLLHFAAAGLGAGLALAADNRLFGLLNAALAGANIMAGVSQIIVARMREAVAEMAGAVDAMGQLNAQIIAGKVEIMMRGTDPDGDRPSIH